MKIGFIGAGNMATSIIKGIIKNNYIESSHIYITNTDYTQTQKLADTLNIHAMSSNSELAKEVDTIVLAVKPNKIEMVLKEIAPTIAEKQILLVSIAAGLTLENLQTYTLTQRNEAIIRVMPNMNVAICEGVSAICGNEFTSPEQVDELVKMFQAVGSSYVIEEKDFRNFTALAGCSPAFTYLYIDAMSRAGVKNGLPKSLATEIAAKAVLGSAQMVLQSENDTPWDLIDKVCSPGGTTIAGLVALEDEKFISTVIKGIDATIERDKELEG